MYKRQVTTCPMENLMAAVESEFGIKFSMGQVVTMKNVGEMADIILQKV